MAPAPARGVGGPVPDGPHRAAIVPTAPRIPIGVPVGVPAGVAGGVVAARSPTPVVVGVDAVPRVVAVGPPEAEGGPDEDRARPVLGGVEAKAHSVEEGADADGEGDVALRRCRRGGQGRRGDQDQWAARCGSHGVLQLVVPSRIHCNPHAIGGESANCAQYGALRCSANSGRHACVRGGGHIVDIRGHGRDEAPKTAGKPSAATGV
jgi:hypothetical protein